MKEDEPENMLESELSSTRGVMLFVVVTGPYWVYGVKLIDWRIEKTTIGFFLIQKTI